MEFNLRFVKSMSQFMISEIIPIPVPLPTNITLKLIDNYGWPVLV